MKNEERIQAADNAFSLIGITVSSIGDTIDRQEALQVIKGQIAVIEELMTGIVGEYPAVKTCHNQTCGKVAENYLHTPQGKFPYCGHCTMKVQAIHRGLGVHLAPPEKINKRL